MYKRKDFIIAHKSVFPISFHDTDAMGVVWHGNYIKFFELAREALFNALGYDYKSMKEDNIIYPITECSCKYRKPLFVTDKTISVLCMLTEFDGKIEINYEVYGGECKTLCAYGKTQQVAVNTKNNDIQICTPCNLVKAILEYEKKNGKNY